jgi:hypothetical protein
MAHLRQAVHRGADQAVTHPHPKPSITTWAASLTAVIGFFILITLITGCRWPLVWCDEPYFADPAFHLARDGQLTSETAYGGPIALAPEPGSLWTGNCPLYSLLLGHWIYWFGFSLFAVRALNLLLYSSAVALLAAALLRLGFLTSRAGALLLPTLLFSSYGLVFLYRQSRYDVLCILECAALFFALSIDHAALRRFLLVAIAITVPWSGFPAVAWLAAAFAVGALACGQRIVIDGACVGIGLVLGLSSLLAWLYAYDGLESFVAVVRSVREREAMTLPARGRIMLQGLLCDRAAIALWCASFVTALSRLRTQQLRRVSPVVIGMGISASAAAVLSFATTRVYDWMVTIPLALGVAAELGDGLPVRLPRLERYVVWAFAVAAAMGLPGVLLATTYEWRERDHSRVEAFVAAHVTSDDFCFCDITAYFPVRRIANRLLVDYGTWPTVGLWDDVQLQAARHTPFTVMVVQSDRAARTIKEFGGGWREEARLPAVPQTWSDDSSIAALLMPLIEAIYPPPLASNRNHRISTDRMYDLAVLRRTTR